MELQGNPATKDSSDVSLLKSKNTIGSKQVIQSQETNGYQESKFQESFTRTCSMYSMRTKSQKNALLALQPVINVTLQKKHFASRCFSKTVKTTTDEVSLDSSFLDVMTSASQNSWTTKLLQVSISNQTQGQKRPQLQKIPLNR